MREEGRRREMRRANEKERRANEERGEVQAKREESGGGEGRGEAGQPNNLEALSPSCIRSEYLCS